MECWRRKPLRGGRLKGQFNAKIAAEFTPPKTWRLQKPLSFETRLDKEQVALLRKVGANVSSHKTKILGKVTCKEGMKTDLASVPRAVWAFISPWDVARAAVIHDHLYASLRKYYATIGPAAHTKASGQFKIKRWKDSRRLSDNIFLWGMQSADPPVSGFKVWSAYWSVRLFGRWPASAKPEGQEK